MDGPMSSPDGERIAALAREVRVDLDTYAERYPIFDRARFPAVALTTAVHVPDLTRADRALLALVSLWIIAFDEIVDEERVSRPALDTLVADYIAIVRGAPRDTARVAGPGDQLGRALREIGRRLAAYTPGTPLVVHWGASFERMVDGIVRQHDLGVALNGEAAGVAPAPARAAAPLSYDALLDIALHSIGVPYYLASSFIVYDDPRIADRLPLLVRIGEACARAIRLANDLRTWEKDAREGSLNTLVAVCAELERVTPGLSAAEYRAQGLRSLEERLAASVARTQSLLALSPVPHGAAEAGIARLVEFVTAFYAAHDYHTFQPG